MSTEQVALVQMLQGLRTSFEKEIIALRHIMRAMDQEAEGDHDYRSGTDFGAFAAGSVMRLEQQVQECLDIFSDLLYQLLEEDDWELLRRDLVRVGADDVFADTLKRDIKTLQQRARCIEQAEQDVLAMSSEEAARLMPEGARERLEENIDRELRDLLG